MRQIKGIEKLKKLSEDDAVMITDIVENMGYDIQVSFSESYDEDHDHVVFQVYSPEGQDCYREYDVTSYDDLCGRVNEDFIAFDISEETMLWLDCFGHGKSGAPEDMMDVYRDMEWLKNLLFEIGETLSCNDPFYFTFGSDSMFPFQNSYIIVYGTNKRDAIEKFRSYYPDRDPESNTYNASDCYNAFEWDEEVSKYYSGDEPKRIIVIPSISGLKKELKPCAFCGGEPRIITGEDFYEYPDFTVCLSEDQIRARLLFCECSECHMRTPAFSEHNKLIEFWNKGRR